MIAEVMKPIAPPAAPLTERRSHSPTVWAILPRLARSDSSVIVGVWNGSLPSRWLTAAIALSPRALRSAVLAHSATPMSMCEIWTVARETMAVIGMTTTASAASTVSEVATPPLNFARSRL